MLRVLAGSNSDVPLLTGAPTGTSSLMGFGQRQPGGSLPSEVFTRHQTIATELPRHWQTHPIPTSFGMNTWRTIEVSLNKNILTTSVDGKELSDYTDLDESYKFGAIALTCRGDAGCLQFQEIMIQELPEQLNR